MYDLPTAVHYINQMFGYMLGITFINIAILALCLKLYTEYFKDRSASRRKEN